MATIQAAIDAITDSTEANPYRINVLPGTYAGFDLGGKVGITIVGSGRATIIETKSGVNTPGSQVWLSGVANTLENMQFNFTTDTKESGTIQFCIQVRGSLTRCIIRNCHFDVKPTNASRTAAIYAIGGLSNKSAVVNKDGYELYIDKCDIVTTLSGIMHAAQYMIITDTNVFMITEGGANTAVSIHTGLSMQYGVGRLYWDGGIIQTGYGYTNKNQPNITVYGVHNNTTALSNAHLELRNVHGILRNNDATGTTTVWVRTEATNHFLSDVRIYTGCHIQCENGATNYSIDSTYTYNTAGRVIIEGSGTFFGNAINGNVFGGVLSIDSNWDTWEATTREVKAGGQWYGDTSVESFTINLPKQSSGAIGEPLRIINSFGGANTLTVGQGKGAPTFADPVEAISDAPRIVIAAGTSRLFYVKADGNYWVE